MSLGTVLLAEDSPEVALVVCDVNLPGELGPAVVAKIRSIRPRTKTLFTSGSPFDILGERGLLVLFSPAFDRTAEVLRYDGRVKPVMAPVWRWAA